LEAEMEVQIRRLSDDIGHESPHDMLVFKIKKHLPKLKIKSVMLPETVEARKEFEERVGKLIDEGVGTKIDIL
jgi:hypothetical protein